MKDSTFAERLNNCLDKEGFPPKNRGRIQLLAEMVGLSHRGASKWINGESTPPFKKYLSLAQKLNVNEQWLRTGEGLMNESKKQDSFFSTQYIGEVIIYDNNSYLTKSREIMDTVQCNLSHSGDFFGVLLDSEAMSPRFPKNSIIILENAPSKDGDFVLVNFEGFPTPIFRQLLIVGHTTYLNAHNPKFDRLILNDNSVILGKLVQAILSFD